MNAALPLEKMTVAEKLQAMEELWTDLSRDENFESPAWHEKILQQRAAEKKFVDWEMAKEQLRARMK
ncbi:MAG: addiction module protein [Limisphaerales bacterium]